MNVAIVILNYNGKALLEQFLPSVLEHSQQATVYLADNASTDGSVAFVKEHFSKVNLIINTQNGGYAKGYNDALKNLKEDVFVLLNSDVEVTQGWLSPILEAFKATKNVVAIQPKILDYKNKDYFEYAGAAGGYIDALGYPYCRGRIFNTLEKDTEQFNDSRQIFWASGACIAVKKEAFIKAGGFDEDLFAHQEEIDLCWRMQQQAGIIQYIGSSTVYHLGGGTLGVENPKKTFYNFRNSLLVMLKNNNRSAVWLILFVRMLLDALAAWQFLLSGKPSHFIAIFKAHLSFYSLVPRFIKKRYKHTQKIAYYQIKSIVWMYFIRKKTTFIALNQNKK
ncbi:MAG TPA: dTDP-Rha--alpha-D-GlcNAc-pyrophosphate polyprenol alpha-3-L-rhamnosyltransferase [Flavobacteriaceae bacterium]|nr:glycosyltransferase [Ulvibacter sp.]HAH33747.1 dTDP-Rha--alpha-D-GlcNAc-pyrophosphate polyprenol alpha-3-L-rhamnosyltransferase [Flavobacteriaceae bacterium]